MAHSSVYAFVVLSLASESVKYFTTAEKQKVNITINRTSVFDSVSSSSLLFPPCCKFLNAQRSFNSNCRCGQTNPVFHEGNLSCVNMERLCYDEGCHFVLEGNEEASPMKLLSRRTEIVEADQGLSTKCKFNISGKLYNKYLDCKGEWNSITAKHITDLFNLTTQFQRKVYLQPKYSSSTAPNGKKAILLGRLVKLEVQCQTGSSLNTHSTCVLVKTLGTTVCTTFKSRKINKKTDCPSQPRKEFQKQSSALESVSTMDRAPGLAGLLALLVEAVVLLFIITALIIICAFRTQRNQTNKRKSGSPSYYRTQSTKPLESSTDIDTNYADPVDVLSRRDGADCSPAFVTGAADKFESISNPIYERGPDKDSVIKTRGDAASLLRQNKLPKPQKRRYTQPPLLIVTPRNAPRKPFLVHATISEEQEDYQENLYDEVETVKPQKINVRKTKFRYSDPFPSGQSSSFHQTSGDKSPQPLHYYEKSIVHDGRKIPGQAKVIASQGKNKPQEAALNLHQSTKSPSQPLHYYEKTIAHEAQRQVLRSALGKQNKTREKDANVQRSNAPLRMIVPERSYVSRGNPETPNKEGSSQICNDSIDASENTTGEHVYATLCCENPNGCTCDEGYGSPIGDKPATLARTDSLEV